MNRDSRPYRNPLRPKLARGEPTLGLWVTLSNAAVTEISVLLGLDWVCIDMEHGATDYAALSDHVRAASGTGLSVFVRVPEIRADTIKRSLDLGADGIVLPLVRDAEDIRRALSFMHYPPRGIRGVGGERAQKWGLRTSDYLATAGQELILMPMIETREAVENIDEILAVDGLDFIFVGPGDLSASLGHLGGWDGPETRDAIAHVVARAAAHGVVTGTYGTGPEDIARRVDQGFRIIAIGSDLAMMAARIQSTLDALSIPSPSTPQPKGP